MTLNINRYFHYFPLMQMLAIITAARALPNSTATKADTWLLACKDVSWSFTKNFAVIIKMTLPLMLLAGVLGAIVD